MGTGRFVPSGALIESFVGELRDDPDRGDFPQRLVLRSSLGNSGETRDSFR